MTTCTVL